MINIFCLQRCVLYKSFDYHCFYYRCTSHRFIESSYIRNPKFVITVNALPFGNSILVSVIHYRLSRHITTFNTDKSWWDDAASGKLCIVVAFIEPGSLQWYIIRFTSLMFPTVFANRETEFITWISNSVVVFWRGVGGEGAITFLRRNWGDCFAKLPPRWGCGWVISPIYMMTSSNGNIFRVTGHLCGEVTGEFPAQSQWRGALMFSLISAWTNMWTNNGNAGVLRRHRAHYVAIVMNPRFCIGLAV